MLGSQHALHGHPLQWGHVKLAAGAASATELIDVPGSVRLLLGCSLCMLAQYSMLTVPNLK